MPRVPDGRSRFNPDEGRRGISRTKYENSICRVRAGKPFELTWKDKIYLRRLRNGETQAHIARVLNTKPSAVAMTLKAAATRFNVETWQELLTLPDVQTILDGDD